MDHLGSQLKSFALNDILEMPYLDYIEIGKIDSYWSILKCDTVIYWLICLLNNKI